MDVGDFGRVLNGFGMFLGGFLVKFEKVCEKKRASRSFAETGFKNHYFFVYFSVSLFRGGSGPILDPFRSPKSMPNPLKNRSIF